MKTKKFPIEAEHRAKFEAYLKDWQRKLNLADWRIFLMDEPASGTAMAEVSVALSDQCARVKLGKYWTEPVTDVELERTALHELLHVRLHAVGHMARGKDAEALNAAEHAVIITLENLILP